MVVGNYENKKNRLVGPENHFTVMQPLIPGKDTCTQCKDIHNLGQDKIQSCIMIMI